MMTHLTDENFKEFIGDTDNISVIDFWATWCGPCRAMAPVFEGLSERGEFAGKVKFAKVDVDKCPLAATTYRIMSIPTIVIYKDGIVAEKLVGFRGEDELVRAISEYI